MSLLPLSAKSLAVKVEPPTTAPRKVVIKAKRLDRPEVITVEGTAPGEVPLPIDPAGTWEVSAAADGLWSPSLITRGGTDAPTYLRMFATGELHGSFHGAKGESAFPTQLSALATPVSAGHDRPVAEIACGIDHEKWICRVPIGVSDIRLASPSYVPHYYWSLDIVQKRATDLGVVEMRHGASVVGSVGIRDARGVRMADVRIDLAPANTPPGAVRLRQTSTPTDKGFFQFAGIPAGEYILSAHTRGLRSNLVRIRVLANMTAEVRDVLWLQQPRRLAISITPPLDPSGNRWRVEVVRKRDGSDTQYDAVAASLAGADGVWEISALNDGDYIATVGTLGVAWVRQDVRLASDDITKQIYVHEQLVEGEVRLGDQPIAAKLRFGGQNSLVGLALESDNGGRFTGVVPPQSGKWHVYVQSNELGLSRTIDVEPESRGDTLFFAISLPKTVLTGHVLKPDGSPESNAIVDVQSADGRTLEQLRPGSSDFQVSGVSPGRYSITANAFKAGSDPVSVEIGEEDNGPIELKLVSKVHIHGRVVTRGVPISGAQIVALPVMEGPRATVRQVSDEVGRFDLLFPGRTSSFDLLVAPPGFPLQMTHLPVIDDDTKVLQVDCDQNGGTLTITAALGINVLLQHDGATWPLSLVATTGGEVHSMTKDESVETTIQLEAGAYTVCGAKGCAGAIVAPQTSSAVSTP